MSRTGLLDAESLCSRQRCLWTTDVETAARLDSLLWEDALVAAVGPRRISEPHHPRRRERLDLLGRIAELGQHVVRVLAEQRRRTRVTDALAVGGEREGDRRQLANRRMLQRLQDLERPRL